MKARLGLYKKYRLAFAYYKLVCFFILNKVIGFDYANIFIQRVDKISLQLILKKYGAIIGNNCDIESGLIFHNCRDYSNLIVGDDCHIGKSCFFDLRDKIIIKSNVVISMQCTFITHIDMSKSSLSNIYLSKQNSIVINKNCYIGVKSTVLQGVDLGEQCFVAANTLVINNVDSKMMVAGIPSKNIKKIN